MVKSLGVYAQLLHWDRGVSLAFAKYRLLKIERLNQDLSKRVARCGRHVRGPSKGIE
jgi:hypothetical protein